MAKPVMPADEPVFSASSAVSSAEHGFYRRWSRRKAEYLRSREALPENKIQLSETIGSCQQLEQTPGPVDEEQAEPELPPIDSLTEHSDLSEFMSSRVADEIRLHALRKVFHSAGFNICDGLDDYAENYRNFEPLGDIVTADLRYQLQRLKKMTGMDKPTLAEAEDELPNPATDAHAAAGDTQEVDTTLALNLPNEPSEQGPQSE